MMVVHGSDLLLFWSFSPFSVSIFFLLSFFSFFFSFFVFSWIKLVSFWNRTPAHYVRWPWPECWWSCPSSSSWPHRPSSPSASPKVSWTISSLTAATPMSLYYLMASTWNSAWSTAAASTSSSTSWGRHGFAKNWQNLRVSGFWNITRQEWRKSAWLWTQWVQKRRLIPSQNHSRPNNNNNDKRTGHQWERRRSSLPLVYPLFSLCPCLTHLKDIFSDERS